MISIYSGGVVIGTGVESGGGNWTVVVNGVADGIYTWTGGLVDDAGNTSPSDSVTFTVDTVNPLAPVISVPATGDFLVTGNVTVSGT